MVPLKCRILNFDVIVQILLTSNILKAIIIAVYVYLLNKTKEKQNFTAFNAIYGLDVIGVKSLKSYRKISS